MHRMRIVMGTLALLLVAAGCSSGEKEPEPEASASPSSVVDPDLRDAAEGIAKDQPGYGEAPPACTKVWRVGRRLPQGYAGCDEVGRLVPKVGTPCVNGQELVSFGDLWALGRQPIRRGPLTGPAYGRTYASCIGR
jgi:hypothetical protein